MDNAGYIRIESVVIEYDTDNWFDVTVKGRRLLKDGTIDSRSRSLDYADWPTHEMFKQIWMNQTGINPLGQPPNAAGNEFSLED
jgi:hypothetical protein